MSNLDRLKFLLTKKKLDGYIIPKHDLFFSEELLEADDRLKFITNFSGSAGWAIIVSLNIKSALISDGRYEEQIKKEVDNIKFKFLKGSIDKIIEFISSNKKLKRIGIDPKLISVKEYDYLKNQLSIFEIDLKLIQKNYVDLIWLNKPKIPPHNINFVSDRYVGESSKIKRNKIINYLDKKKCDAFFSFKPDSSSWLLNARDNQLKYSPVLRCYTLIHKNKNIYIFFENFFKDSLFNKTKTIKVFQFKNLKTVLKDFKNENFLIDPVSTPVHFLFLLKKLKIKITYTDCPISNLKTQKNLIEQKNLKYVHKIDGLAFIKFWKWFENEQNITKQNEETLSTKLFNFRSESKLFKGNSFPTISAFGKNGSIIHYRYKKNNSYQILTNNLYLIDSGGQYLNGTTDITRVLIHGLPSKEMIKKYTLVLKGHLALANLLFPKGTLGRDIDCIPRTFLWEHKIDYPHGTGHGVGFYLNVHEGPISINKTNKNEIKPGMVISNEPGFYGKKFGIRIENLELVKEVGNFLKFESLTLVPFERKLIDKEILTISEVNLINKYHEKVYKNIFPLVKNDKFLTKFLKLKTSKL